MGTGQVSITTITSVNSFTGSHAAGLIALDENTEADDQGQTRKMIRRPDQPLVGYALFA